MSACTVHVRVPIRKSFDGQLAAVGETEGRPLVEIQCDLVPARPAAVRIDGLWLVPADPDKAFRLNEFWRDAR